MLFIWKSYNFKLCMPWYSIGWV